MPPVTEPAPSPLLGVARGRDVAGCNLGLEITWDAADFGDPDVILTTGGASGGDEAYMVGALDRLGKRHMWQIAIKPGRPMTFGQIGNCVYLGLPGNPVPAFICFLLYAVPVLRLLSGGAYRSPLRIPVPAGFEGGP